MLPFYFYTLYLLIIPIILITLIFKNLEFLGISMVIFINNLTHFLLLIYLFSQNVFHSFIIFLVCSIILTSFASITFFIFILKIKNGLTSKHVEEEANPLRLQHETKTQIRYFKIFYILEIFIICILSLLFFMKYNSPLIFIILTLFTMISLIFSSLAVYYSIILTNKQPNALYYQNNK